MRLVIANNRGKLLRFALVGGINTAIDIGLLFGLTALGLPKLAANTVSTGLAFIFSFFANKSYTFRAQGDVRRQLIFFCCFHSGGFVGAAKCGYFLRFAYPGICYSCRVTCAAARKNYCYWCIAGVELLFV